MIIGDIVMSWLLLIVLILKLVSNKKISSEVRYFGSSMCFLNNN